MPNDENCLNMNLLDTIGDCIPGVFFQFKLLPDSTFLFPWITEGIESRTGVAFTQIQKDPKKLFDKIEPGDRKAIWQAIQNSAASLEKLDIQFRMKAGPAPASYPVLDGWVWKICRAKPERMEDGSVLWTGAILDIT